MRIQRVANMNIPFKYLKDTVKTVGIGPQDIVDSTNETLVLGLIWSIIVFFTAKDLEGIAGGSKAADGKPKKTAGLKELKATLLGEGRTYHRPAPLCAPHAPPIRPPALPCARLRSRALLCAALRRALRSPAPCTAPPCAALHRPHLLRKRNGI